MIQVKPTSKFLPPFLPFTFTFSFFLLYPITYSINTTQNQSHTRFAGLHLIQHKNDPGLFINKVLIDQKMQVLWDLPDPLNSMLNNFQAV